MPATRPKLWDIARAQLALWRARRRLRKEPLGQLTGQAPGTPVASQPLTGNPHRARALAAAINTAATHGLFRPFCLVRSMALQELLQQEGITGSNIHIGVRRRDGEFAAHAWVRWGDELLGDEPDHVATFTEVRDVRVLGAP